jgi:ankyrin repeat protein
LLLKEQAVVNLQANNGATALISAIKNEHYQVAQLLLKEQADVNLHTNDRYTALMFASQNGHYQTVELLLKKQADVNIQTREGVTALLLASTNASSSRATSPQTSRCYDSDRAWNDSFDSCFLSWSCRNSKITS